MLLRRLDRIGWSLLASLPCWFLVLPLCLLGPALSLCAGSLPLPSIIPTHQHPSPQPSSPQLLTHISSTLHLPPPTFLSLPAPTPFPTSPSPSHSFCRPHHCPHTPSSPDPPQTLKRLPTSPGQGFCRQGTIPCHTRGVIYKTITIQLTSQVNDRCDEIISSWLSAAFGSGSLKWWILRLGIKCPEICHGSPFFSFLPSSLFFQLPSSSSFFLPSADNLVSPCTVPLPGLFDKYLLNWLNALIWWAWLAGDTMMNQTPCNPSLTQPPVQKGRGDEGLPRRDAHQVPLPACSLVSPFLHSALWKPTNLVNTADTEPTPKNSRRRTHTSRTSWMCSFYLFV